MRPSLFCILLGTVALFCTGCQTAPKRPLPTVARVDLQRYAGKWYEVTRLPNSFQKDDETATADYRLRPDGQVGVVNTAIAPDGKTRSVRGSAEAVPGSNNARLRVKFEGLAALAPAPNEGNYWIIELDPSYRFAMVGTPDRKFLWILSRTPGLPGPTLAGLVIRAEKMGFPTEKLIQPNRE